MPDISRFSTATLTALFTPQDSTSLIRASRQLEQTAGAKVRQDKIAAAYDLRTRALDRIGAAERLTADLTATYDSVMTSGSRDKITRFWGQVESGGRDLRAASADWISATRTLIALGEISATSDDLAEETAWLADRVDRAYGGLLTLTGRGSADQRIPDDLRWNVRVLDRDLRDWRSETGARFNDFIRTTLDRDPTGVRAGRRSILA